MSATLPLTSAPAALRVPQEAWDIILNEIQNVTDLANLARVSRKLHAVVTPSHLQYHSIASRINNVELWNELIKSSVKRKRIHRLRLYSPSSYWPKKRSSRHFFSEWHLGMTKGAYVHSTGRPASRTDYKPGWLDALRTAVSTMERLRELALCVDMNQFLELGPLFSALSTAVEALHLHVIGNGDLKFTGDHQSYLNWVNKHTEVVNSIRGGYRVFSCLSSCLYMTGDKFVEKTLQLLSERCPDLEDLKIVCEEGMSDIGSWEFLWGSTWPKLRKLYVKGARHYRNIFEGFGERHQLLENVAFSKEEVSFGDFGVAAVESMPRSLSRLQILESDHDRLDFWKTVLSPMSDGSYRPIRTLTFDVRLFSFKYGSDVPGLFRHLTEFASFSHHVGNLTNLTELSLIDGRTLPFASMEDSDFFLPFLNILSGSMKNVRVLTVQPSEWFGDEYESKDRIKSWLETLSRYPELEEVRGQKESFLKPFVDYTEKKLLSGFGSACPRILRVDDWVKSSSGEWALDAKAAIRSQHTDSKTTAGGPGVFLSILLMYLIYCIVSGSWQ